MSAFRVSVLILGLVLVVSIAFGLGQRQATAQLSPIGLESRINQLETDSFQLRSQVSRLTTLVERLASSPVPSAPRLEPLPAAPRQPVTSRDPMFDRLATLAIELKERIVKLETCQQQLKQRFLNPASPLKKC